MKKILQLLLVFTVVIAACENSDINFTYSDSYMETTSTNSGVGGSMARFAIAGNYLYTVDGSHLKTFDISDNTKMTLKSNWALDWSDGIETIFPYGNKLFLGTTSGMYIIDISNPGQPTYITKYEHIVSCDPVVVQGNYAYVTLRSGETGCWRAVNELQIINIGNIYNPFKEEGIPLTKPFGLGVDDNLLFVCDNGLKVFELKTPTSLVQINHFPDLTNAYDVIPYNGILLVIAKDGLRQYTYENNEISEISSILVNNL